MFLAEKMVHKAKELQSPFVLLKIDIFKAFDSVEWRFLKALLERVGAGTRFIGFYDSIFVNANSAVVINGRTSKTFDISCSVRQGCPASFLLFIMLLEGLSCMIQKALMAVRALRGVPFKKAGLELAHQFYSDNTTMLVQTDKANVQKCVDLFDTFGTASGLKVNWKDTAAVMISSTPKPQELDSFGWQWETEGNFSKLLGFHFGDGISQDMVWTQINTKLEAQIVAAKHHPFNYMERVVLINQQYEASMWYIMMLWRGKDGQLEELERKTRKFLWEGQKTSAHPRVQHKQLTRPTKEGGVGLIALGEQSCAMTSQMMF